MKHDLKAIANTVQQLALHLGANEASVSVSQSASTELTQREGKIERTKQSLSLIHI